MELSQLRCFAALANMLNFRQTARALGLSQSSVSRQIGELERSLGVALFERSSRRVTLTQEGAALLPYAQDMLTTAQSAEHMVELLHKGASGHLYVSALSTCSTVLTAALERFFDRHPDVIVDVAMQTARDQKAALGEKRYDVHLISRDMLPAAGKWEWFRTHQDSLALVVPKGRFGGEGTVELSRLGAERFIVSQEPDNAELFRRIMSVCAQYGYTPNIMNRYDKLESVLLAVSAGLGVSIMPSAFPSMMFADSVDVYPIEGVDTARSYIAAWPAESRNPTLPLFLEVLRETVGQTEKENGERNT